MLMVKQKTSRMSVLSLAVAAACAAAVPNPVLAQGMVLEEVVVTARKRAESLQETPLAVTALDATALREAGLASATRGRTSTPAWGFISTMYTSADRMVRCWT